LQGFNTLIDSSSLRVSRGWLAKAGLKSGLKKAVQMLLTRLLKKAVIQQSVFLSPNGG
jgi:hypothetical protein